MNEIFLTPEELTETENLSALGYTAVETALYLGVSDVDFCTAAVDESSKVYYHIRRGRLRAKAEPELRLLEMAKLGNITAIQQLDKAQKERNFRDLLNEMDEYELNTGKANA